MLIKIDHTVKSLVIEDRADLVAQLSNSKRMYSWFDGENIGETIDNFALANPRATFGDFIEWTKRTYMDRLGAHKKGVEFTAYALEGDYNPTATKVSSAQFARHGESAKGVTVIESVPARLKAGPKKVAEPGSEEEKRLDEIDAAALSSEPTDNPLTPPSLAGLKPLEPGQAPDAATPLGKRGL